MLLGFTLNLQKYLFWIVLAQTGSNKTIDFQANDIFFELGGVGHPISFFLSKPNRGKMNGPRFTTNSMIRYLEYVAIASEPIPTVQRPLATS